MYSLASVVSILHGGMRGEALILPNYTSGSLEFLAPSASTSACGVDLQGAMADMVRVWNLHTNSAPVVVQSGDGRSCNFQEGGTSADRFTILNQKGDLICNSRPAYADLAFGRTVADEEQLAEDDAFAAEDPFLIGTFPVPDGMPGGAGARNYVVAWPPVRRCTGPNPCPMVLHLHGFGEHGPNVGRLKLWGFLNYYVHDETCRNALGSVVLLPQLNPDENWAEQGPACFEHFVYPLLQHVLHENANIDRDRIAVAGYSGGAVGAVLGAALYPDTFTILAAGSASGPPAVWETMQEAGIFTTDPVGGQGVQRRLRLAAFAWAEGDLFNTSIGMNHLLGLLQHNGALGGATVNVRYYSKEVQHMEASEALFNHWPFLHEVLWEGHFGTKFR